MQRLYEQVVGRGGEDQLKFELEQLLAEGEYGDALIRAIALEMSIMRRRVNLGYEGKKDAMEWTLGLVLAYASMVGEKTRDYGPPAYKTAPKKPEPNVFDLPPPVSLSPSVQAFADRYKESKEPPK
jgi:hypothetical protein